MRRKRKVRFVQVKPACTLRTELAAVLGFIKVQPGAAAD